MKQGKLYKCICVKNYSDSGRKYIRGKSYDYSTNLYGTYFINDKITIIAHPLGKGIFELHFKDLIDYRVDIINKLI